jgi:hypothetical protein
MLPDIEIDEAPNNFNVNSLPPALLFRCFPIRAFEVLPATLNFQFALPSLASETDLFLGW